MGKIIVGSAQEIEGIRLSLEKRLEYSLTPDTGRDNYFVEMYGINRLGNDLGSKLFLGLIYQLTWAKRFSEKDDVVIVEKPEAGLSIEQKRIVILSILHLLHIGRDVILETNDRDFVSLVQLLQSIKKNNEGAEKLIGLLGVDRYQRIWSQIFADVLRNLHTEIGNNTTDNTKEAVS